MERFFARFAALWALICHRIPKKAHHVPDETSTKVTWKRQKQASFYSQIPTTQIRLYQAYIDRAFQLSPTLEFEKNDCRFNRLLAEAAKKDALSQIDLELMRIQYVLADRESRREYRRRWAVKVVNRDQNDFFPSPWAVLATFFSSQRRGSGSGCADTIQ